MSLMARISIFIFSLVLFCCFPALSEAQETEPAGEPAEALGSDTTVRKPVFNGLYLGLDVANPALHFLGTGYMQCETSETERMHGKWRNDTSTRDNGYCEKKLREIEKINENDNKFYDNPHIAVTIRDGYMSCAIGDISISR